ncbi:hypothetical protein CAEBREN_12256 [Caenorhabditis brenneri]|uniref:Serpentine Receptor, class H n=1 Tax=Caenorhabditis brenneri TaxID=135651 RepID=G0P9N2_CAEBE|nr:hypothetical protein CAEBREN_12256 [Caenorhabditis brenneri]
MGKRKKDGQSPVDEDRKQPGSIIVFDNSCFCRLASTYSVTCLYMTNKMDHAERLFRHHLTPSLRTMNCYDSAPEIYSSLLRYPQIISVILYSFSFKALLEKHDKNFDTFRKLLLWHTVGSFVSQMYFSFLALPVSYLPLPFYRCAGFLMYFNVPGVLVMNLELIFITHSALSIVELLRYRLEAARPDQSKFDPVKILIYLFRLNLIIIFLFLTGSTPHAIKKQSEYKTGLISSNLFLFNIVSCDNVFVFPPITDSQYLTMLCSICSVTTTTLFLVIISVITIPFRLHALKKTASKKTIEVQKMFFVSVVLQALINSLFFIFPVSEFLKYAFQKDSSESSFQFIYVLMPYHGTAATFVMICFTRPVREKIIGYFKCEWKNKVASRKNVSQTLG